MICGLGALGLGALGTRAARAQDAEAALANPPGPLTLLCAGPDGGLVSRWGSACTQAFDGSFPGNAAVLAQAVGGLDGVSGANQFDAQMMPDGRGAAMLPGAALTAYLTGDQRVHYDPTRWTPVLAGITPGVLMVRAAAGAVPDLAALQAFSPLKLAADQAESADLAALLALARLNVATSPVFGLRGAETKTRAFLDGSVDAVFLSGEGVPADVSALNAAGAVAVLSLGQFDTEGRIVSDPLFPDLPDVAGFGPAASPFLERAYQAAAAAARLDFLLVLPHLTSPDAVAQWTQAAETARQSETLAEAASASAVTLAPAPVLAAALAALSLSEADAASLQAFLVKSYGWQPD
ncbi:hypothetical protein [Acidocella sp.]|uniref:hypothetical protein n=1 Tax=Acidocella sp. TaxID=50710 RepID=UPI0026148B2F|nr:hypothetical protein [Acidocella sp.]